MYISIYIYIYIHMCIHMHIYIYMYAYIYKQTRRAACFLSVNAFVHPPYMLHEPHGQAWQPDCERTGMAMPRRIWIVISRKYQKETQDFEYTFDPMSS